VSDEPRILLKSMPAALFKDMFNTSKMRSHTPPPL